ncbi:hypothetical protein D3C87_1547510 [compost metagenome]
MAGTADFAHDEHGAITIDLDRHIGIAQITLTQLGGNGGFELRQRLASGGNLTDEREGDITSLIDRIGICQPGLFEHVDAQPVTAIYMIGLQGALVKRLGRRLICRATGKGR